MVSDYLTIFLRFVYTAVFFATFLYVLSSFAHHHIKRKKKHGHHVNNSIILFGIYIFMMAVMLALEVTSNHLMCFAISCSIGVPASM